MNLKQKIFEVLDLTGYLTDQEAARMYGKDKEINFCTVEEYKRQWRKLQADRNFFADKKIIKVEKHGKYRIAELENGDLYRIGKDFYEEKLSPVAFDL
jgi:hypothetical protein